ncbi:MAG: ImmA/IrrE family metallo-endopeptidase [Candidatus Merdivicinus sp.]|jgi:Zn-dependent peptidase ImmA (M78 family)
MEKLQQLYEIADAHDIGVYYYDVGEAPAATISGDGFCAIALNPKDNRSEKQELEHLSHEMGHIETGILHRADADSLEILRNEYRCAAWVVKYLVPIEELREVVEKGYTEVWELAEYFGVSEECILDAVKIYRNRGLL